MIQINIRRAHRSLKLSDDMFPSAKVNLNGLESAKIREHEYLDFLLGLVADDTRYSL